MAHYRNFSVAIREHYTTNKNTGRAGLPYRRSTKDATRHVASISVNGDNDDDSHDTVDHRVATTAYRCQRFRGIQNTAKQLPSLLPSGCVTPNNPGGPASLSYLYTILMVRRRAKVTDAY